MTTCLVAACGGGDLALPISGEPTDIRVVDGNGQRGSVGQPLAAPVIVEVTDAKDEPVEGAIVEFALTSAGDGAEIAPATATTNAEGHAQAHVLLGSKVGLQTGEARVAVDGATAPTASFSAVAVADSLANRQPRADFDWHCEDLDCQFTDASTDSDGSVTGWLWHFGDGDTSTEREPSHSYTTEGTYTVTLSVTDDGGSSDESSSQVTVNGPAAPPPNNPPRAEFGVDCVELRCTFADNSDDDDGSIESRLWDFGDGATSTARNPSHLYGAPGRYEVVLTVTDDDGAVDSKTHDAEPSAPPPPPPPPPNDPPRAEFEVDCVDLRCTFADNSDDPDGNIVSRLWDFGDGATSTERNPSHSYGAAGHYEVVLTVTDNDGASDTQTHTAEPSAPPPPPPPPPPDNEPPHADFDVHCSGLTCTFNDKSKDDDGSIVGWQWSFGDGATSIEQSPVHTYAISGHYDAVLTVTDDRGGTNTKTRRADAKD